MGKVQKRENSLACKKEGISNTESNIISLHNIGKRFKIEHTTPQKVIDN
jgi:hypothetical protein